MRVLTLLLVLTISAAAAENIPSPDGAYVLEIGKSARIVDHSHATVLTVVPNVQGLREVAAQWSADSHRVVLVLNYDRGAGVYAAYLEGGIWKRTIEQDSDFPSADLARQASVSGWVAADKRMIGSKAFSFRITPEWKDESNPRCEFSHPEGEPVLDNHQVVECRETLYRNVSHLGMKSSLHAA